MEITKWFNIFVLFGFLATILSITWWFLFGALSISTGELKPRGTFIDEHGLPVQALSKQIATPRRRLFKSNNSVKCSNLRMQGICRSVTVDQVEITVLRFEAEHNPTSVENIVVILPFVGQLHSYFGSHLVGELEELASNSMWLSKNIVVILLVPIHASRSSSKLSISYRKILSNLLIAQEDISISLEASALGSPYHNILPTGIIRDAYIIEGLDSPIHASYKSPSSTTDNHALDNKGENYAKKWLFSGIQLLFLGDNAQLPNMDLLATILSLGPDGILTECDPYPDTDYQRYGVPLYTAPNSRGYVYR